MKNLQRIRRPMLLYSKNSHSEEVLYKIPLKDGDQKMSAKNTESKNHTILTSGIGFIQGE